MLCLCSVPLYHIIYTWVEATQPLIGSKIPAAQMHNLKQMSVKVIYLQRSMVPAGLKGEQDNKRILKYL